MLERDSVQSKPKKNNQVRGSNFTATEISTNIKTNNNQVKFAKRDKSGHAVAPPGGSGLLAQQHAELGEKLNEVGLQPNFYKNISAKESSTITNEAIGNKINLYSLAEPFPTKVTPSKNMSRKKERML